jgi:hypothetical protein
VGGAYGLKDFFISASQFSCFYKHFKTMNGLDRVSRMGLENHWTRGGILEFLVDQIVFESASTDLDGPLECSYICLQTLRGTIVGYMGDRKEKLMKWDREYTGYQGLSDLQDALMWILQEATDMRYLGYLPLFEDDYEVPSFAKIAIKRIEEHGSESPGQFRSFEFANEMSSEEWEDWSAKVKTIIMGASLGGLGCGPMYGRDKFTRDPDGTCGWTSSA